MRMRGSKIQRRKEDFMTITDVSGMAIQISIYRERK